MKKALYASLLSLLFGGSFISCAAITRGVDLEPGRAPYFVNLVNAEFVHQCGGTLVGPDLVMTAASCAPTGIAWTRDISWAMIGYETATRNGTMIGVDEIYVQPSWDSSTGAYDVMLLKLSSASTIRPATFNTDSAFPDALSAAQISVLGIGTGTILQSASLVYISDQLCFAYLKAGGAQGSLYRNLPSDTICATLYSTAGQCTGDLGGPMAILGGNATGDVIVGVMAMNSGCAAGVPYPTKGVRTSAVTPFIENIACAHSVSPPASYGCGTKAPVAMPSNAPSASPIAQDLPAASPSNAGADPSSEPSSVPSKMPMEPSSEPSSEPSEMPTDAPVKSSVSASPTTPVVTERACMGRGSKCNVPLDCCSGRCMLSECQASYIAITGRHSLRGPGRGGAAGAVVDVGLVNRGTLEGYGFGG